jgi:tRNA pseudouridine55 synthase
MTGLFLFNKPKNRTSRFIVNELIKIYPQEKIGHGGTLDPLAEGLLLIAVGKDFTQKLEFFQKNVKKEYLVTIDFSLKSKTLDLEGPLEKIEVSKIPTKDELALLITREFLGEIEQLPPLTSAKKIKGKRLYQYFRENKEIEPKPSKVILYEFQILDYNFPLLKLKMVVSSGFYIRSFARDLGEKLNLGNTIIQLIRTKQGPFDLESALSLEEFLNEKILLYGKIMGKVHGVGFRSFLFEMAKKFGISGWVRNVLPNAVEFSAIGYKEALEEFQKMALKGPIGAKISDKEFIIKKNAKNFSGFDILPTEAANLYSRFEI